MGDRLRVARLIRSLRRDLGEDPREPLTRKLRRMQTTSAPELGPALRAVVPYDPRWAALFEEERARLGPLFGMPEPWVIHHIGSSAIPGLAGKPIVDMLIGAGRATAGSLLEAQLVEAGYTPYGPSPSDPEAEWFWRIEPDRAFVAHVCSADSPWIDTTLLFRDYMRARPDERRDYAAAKAALNARGLTLLEYSLEKLVLFYGIMDRAACWRGSA